MKIQSFFALLPRDYIICNPTYFFFANFPMLTSNEMIDREKQREKKSKSDFLRKLRNSRRNVNIRAVLVLAHSSATANQILDRVYVCATYANGVRMRCEKQLEKSDFSFCKVAWYFPL